LPPEAEIEPALGLDLARQPSIVEAALREGEAGSHLFITDPAEINRLQRIAVEETRLAYP
jgi:beta-glucosidase